MKRIIILLCSYLVLFLVGCQNNNEDPMIESALSTSRYSDVRGIYYEQFNGYRAAFYSKDAITVERIINWIDSCPSSEGYYDLIFADPASWDMFLYYFPEGGLSAYYSFRFWIEDQIVRVYVEADETNPNFSFFSDYLLIRIQAPRGGPWPSFSKLYINGDRIERHDC